MNFTNEKLLKIGQHEIPDSLYSNLVPNEITNDVLINLLSHDITPVPIMNTIETFTQLFPDTLSHFDNLLVFVISTMINERLSN